MKDDRIFISTGCLSHDAFKAIREEDLVDDQWAVINEHIKDCEMCSDALGGILVSDNFEKVVSNLKKEIDLKSAMPVRNKYKKLIVITSVAASFIILIGIALVLNNRNDNFISDSINPIVNSDFFRPFPDIDSRNVDQIADNNVVLNSKIFCPGEVGEKNNFSDQVFLFSEEMPEFPGGISSLDEFIKESVRDAEEEFNVRSCGKVTVEFLIDKDGKVENPVVVNGGSKLLNDIAVSIIKNLPVWRPGYQSGEAVNVSISLPVRFDNC